MEFSQLASTENVAKWARNLFLIRYPKTNYSNNYWNMRKYEKSYNGGVLCGSDGPRNFKLTLIM